MNILLFGAPGAGKGTQSANLVEHLGMKHISTGDLFRYAIKNETKLGLEAKGYLDKGELVPDSVTIGMVEEVLQDLSGQSFILDGFPRTVTQAEALDEMTEKLSLNIDKAIFFKVPESLLMSRLTGRRLCKSCGAVYHVEYKPPPADGKCTQCGEEAIYQRSDDQEEAIAKRLEVYEASTAPVMAYYQEKGKLVEVDGTGTSDDIFERLRPVLKD